MLNTETEHIFDIQSPKTPSLNEIQKTIAGEISTFNNYFRSYLKTDVFLLNLIINYLLKMKGKQMRPLLVPLTYIQLMEQKHLHKHPVPKYGKGIVKF